ncbi:uncharacterized protein EHS24_001752 [Apiotrichum porosum]|uniref:Uncharacterized protein n=1 Tax=Apiotrichum porosum TaxID=105984 RepID=A0A427XJ71_9TREE|nr:uncharacterized protein EHS24_001752 [Apiotrichum porosum]RSH78833.1 hypothetical protein EHS24_001752 [Apiotrichum porosum]
MDLSALNSSLPPGLADAERDMGDKFRAAALSITTLYKSSLALNKHAYQVGYSAALADVLSKLQSDIAAGEDAASALARLMDWTEARQTAMAAFAADDEEQPGTAQRPATSRRSPCPTLPLRRNLGSRAASSSTTLLPTSTFNFSIPTTLEIPPQSGPAQTGPIGSKRPIIDAEMADGTINVGAAPSTPSRSGGRASKRRSLGLGLGMADQEEKEPRSADRRRQPRRGGHGASGGGVQRASSPL